MAIATYKVVSKIHVGKLYPLMERKIKEVICLIRASANMRFTIVYNSHSDSESSNALKPNGLNIHVVARILHPQLASVQLEYNHCIMHYDSEGVIMILPEPIGCSTGGQWAESNTDGHFYPALSPKKSSAPIINASSSQTHIMQSVSTNSHVHL